MNNNQNLKLINKCLNQMQMPQFGSIEFKFQNNRVVDVIRVDKVDKKKLCLET
jgi:hypothetical protein